MKGQLYTTHDIGRLLQVNPSTVSKWMEKGLVKGFSTPGGHRRIAEADLVTFLREHGMPVPASLGGDGKVPEGCQHVHLISSVRAAKAVCEKCGKQFKLSLTT